MYQTSHALSRIETDFATNFLVTGLAVEAVTLTIQAGLFQEKDLDVLEDAAPKVVEAVRKVLREDEGLPKTNPLAAIAALTKLQTTDPRLDDVCTAIMRDALARLPKKAQ